MKTDMKKSAVKNRRTKIGTVVSIVDPHTCVVEVSEILSHPKYFKRYRRSKRFHAHTAEVTLSEGQTVTIVESRPYSKLKHWRVTGTTTKQPAAE